MVYLHSVEYLNRDSGNYKSYGFFVVRSLDPNPTTVEERIKGVLMGEMYFDPDWIGVERLDGESDVTWHEIFSVIPLAEEYDGEVLDESRVVQAFRESYGTL